MKCLWKRVFWLVAPIFVLNKSYGVPTKTPVRNGKFMAFTAHDMFGDLLDDVQDPLPVAGTHNDKEKLYVVNDTEKTTTRPSKGNDVKMTKLPIKTEEKIALYNQDTGKFELITTTSGHFSFPMKPVTDKGVFFYGGQHYQYRRPVQPPLGGNRTEEIKIFWSSIGDAVENSPYFPIQINVPDMITAMTNFLVNYIPFINRLTNPNHPRLPYQTLGQNNTEQMDYYDKYDLYQPVDNTIRRRDFENDIRLVEKSSKGKRKTKRKSNKRKESPKATSKRIFQRPNLRITTGSPVEEIKLWHQFGSDQKETLRLKNMPITRKRVRVADREIFNFKNSDISNSPIMILNVPQRPITHYKVTHQEIREKEASQPQPSVQTSAAAPTQKPLPLAKSAKVIKPKRKLKTEGKQKRSSKRSGRSDAAINEQSTESTITS